MKLLLATALAALLSAPCMAASENQSEDHSQGDVQAPGVTEPRVPDTLKPNADQRIQTEGRASETAGEKAPAERPGGDKDEIKK